MIVDMDSEYDWRRRESLQKGSEDGGSMKRVVLLHQDFIQHYRVPVYNYLSEYLASRGYELTVVSSGVEEYCPHKVRFQFVKMTLALTQLRRYLKQNKPDAVIFFVNLKNHYLFPLIFFCRVCGIKVIYWGHGRDLSDKRALLKNILYWFEHSLSDAIVLYAVHLKPYISFHNRKKTFVANNTLNLTEVEEPHTEKRRVLEKYGIETEKNILFVGRLQKRKKLDMLLEAHSRIGGDEVGLVIVGPIEDTDIELSGYDNIFKVGPIYGNALFELMSAMDVYCMPGWVGLSIVDAFFMGLPLVALEGDHPPEISYLRHGDNGYLLPSGDVGAMAEVLQSILFDSDLRERLSNGASQTYRREARIDRMCEGFYHALSYALRSH